MYLRNRRYGEATQQRNGPTIRTVEQRSAIERPIDSRTERNSQQQNDVDSQTEQLLIRLFKTD